MDNQAEKEILFTIREILKWIRIQAQPVAKTRIEAALPETGHRKLYQSLDGSRTQSELAKALGVSQPTVSRLISSWVREGIVEESSPGRYARSFDLEALGIDIKTGDKK